jgi:heptaprenyl diphosphate synthase
VLAATAVAVYVFESIVPVPLPWARLGLSNVVVTITLFGYGLKEAFLVNLVRIVAGNLVLGLILSPAFLFSAAGSMSALLVMAVARWKLVPPLSVVGTSCLGAVPTTSLRSWSSRRPLRHPRPFACSWGPRSLWASRSGS